MKCIFKGEELEFFPSFFLALNLFLVLTCAFCPGGHGAERNGLSPYDRWAEEATLLNSRGQTEKVIALLEPHKADLKNDSALFFNELGIAYRRAGRYSEAAQAYHSALSRDPENPVVMKNLGDTLFLRKEYPRAVEQYQKALRSNPRFQQAHSNLALAYYEMKQYRESLDEFEIVLKLDPKNDHARKFRETILKKMRGSK